MRLSDLMDPEEAVGNIWHDMASGIGAEVSHPGARVSLASVRPSLALLFRAVGGGAGVALAEAPATVMRHRRPLRRKIGAEGAPTPPGAATTSRKLGARKNNEQNRRSDSFIIHRFESILSWVESMNINRSVHDDKGETAQKAAEDQDRITLSKHDRKTATRLRLRLDLSPADADHEALAGVHIYPEWNHRIRSYMEGHCRVRDAPAQPGSASDRRPDPHRIRQVRRQFETMRPRRVLQPRQVEGSALDLDALLTTRADLKATGRGSDRIWQAARQTERDLSVLSLVDMSRSTEAAIGETSVIDVAREAVAELAAASIPAASPTTSAITRAGTGSRTATWPCARPAARGRACTGSSSTRTGRTGSRAISVA